MIVGIGFSCWACKKQMTHDPTGTSKPTKEGGGVAIVAPATRTQAPPTTNEEKPPEAVRQAAEDTFAKVRRALGGDPDSKHELSELANDENAETVQRQMAFAYFKSEGSNDSLRILAKQLLSKSPAIRTYAYYALPERVRPPHFEYTAEPNDETRLAVEHLLFDLK